MSDQQRKIIIDEDWKSQVESEKEALREKPTDDVDPSMDQAGGDGQLPPASFVSHLMSLATQATAALGQIPDPAQPEQQPTVHLDFARYLIDTIVVLQEKTQGNLTSEEAMAVENIVHQLRLSYVEVGNAQ